MTAQFVSHLNRYPVKLNDVAVPSSADLLLHLRAFTQGQLWDRIEEGKRRD